MNLFKPDIKRYRDKPALKNACRVLESGYKSVLSFYDLFNQIRTTRRGGTRTEEQDLLRAMLLFSSSTLDSTVKELIKEGLEHVIIRDVGARKQLEDFVENRIRKSDIPEENRRAAGLRGVDTKYIAAILVSDSPLAALITDLVNELIKDSLQSVDQLLKVAAHFAITTEEIIDNIALMKQVFRARNDITHEMDIQPNRTYLIRRPRREIDMLSYSNELLKTTEKFILIVAKKLNY